MFLEVLYNVLIPVVIALIASSGFWALLEKRTQRSTQQTELLIALTHDRLVWLGMNYVRRGWIFYDEYENLLYLFKPYEKLGGNGSVLRVMEEIKRLPVRYQTIFTEKENTDDKSVKPSL